MEAKDLRYGNFVTRKGKVWTVNNIHGSSGLIHVLPNGSDSLSTRACGDFQPITLTEDWLKRLGFWYNSGRWEHPINQFMVLEDFSDGLYFSGDEGVKMSKSFEFVHELQNLFYCLHGSELEIKEIA